MDAVIEVEQLSKRYDGVVAIDDVTFTVHTGEIFGLLGPNGAGKTTTVECIQGLRRRDHGRVAVLGVDPQLRPDRLRRQVGSQLQMSALPDRLHVGEAIKLFGALAGATVDVTDTLAAWDLTPLARQPFATLSGGQRQRLFLALALLGRPQLLFLDELTMGLDPQARRGTWDLVAAVRDRGATVVLVTHFMEEAEALCDRVAIVDAGRIVALDTPAALTAHLSGRVEMTFTAAGCDLRFLNGVDGVWSVSATDGTITVSSDAAAIVKVAAALVGHGIAPPDFRTRYPTLEDVFLATTGHRLRD